MILSGCYVNCIHDRLLFAISYKKKKKKRIRIVLTATDHELIFFPVVVISDFGHSDDIRTLRKIAE